MSRHFCLVLRESAEALCTRLERLAEGMESGSDEAEEIQRVSAELFTNVQCSTDILDDIQQATGILSAELERHGNSPTPLRKAHKNLENVLDYLLSDLVLNEEHGAARLDACFAQRVKRDCS
jgi:hypothetical protein